MSTPIARDLVAQLVVEALDRQRLGAQHGIAELAHVAQRRRRRRAATSGSRGGGGAPASSVTSTSMLFGHRTRVVLTGSHCGSTSTLKRAARWAFVAADRLAPPRDAGDRGAAVGGLDHDLARSLPRRRNSGAGPSRGPGAERAWSAAAAAWAAPGSSQEQTTRISVENGG